MLSQALQNNDLDARYLELEITESANMQNPEKAAATLCQLKYMGISIALDDFGIGCSSTYKIHAHSHTRSLNQR